MHVNKCLKLHRSLALVNRPFSADARRCGNRIEQPAAGTGVRTVNAFGNHAVQETAWFAGEEIIKVQFATVGGKTLPAHFFHEVRVGVAPGFVDRLFAAGHGRRFERSKMLALAIIGKEKLSAPEFAIIAVTQAIKSYADNRPGVQGDAVLCHAGCNVGVVMLHFLQAQRTSLGHRQTQFARQVFGMSIHRNNLRVVLEELQIRLDRLDVVGMATRVGQISHVVRQNGLAVTQQAEAVLQFAAHGQHRRCRSESVRQADGRWRVAARPAHQAWHSGHDTNDGIIDTTGNFAVMHQEIVGDTTQPASGIGVIDALRFVTEIAAGQHHGARHPPHHEVVQRRVGKHETQ